MNPPVPGVVSITTSQRRRFLWCAWWTGDPAREPFRAPDAWSGGARTEAEAQRAAERAAGRSLRIVPPLWARAWVRVQAGAPPWVEKGPRRRKAPPPGEDPRERRRAPRPAPFPGCPFAALGLPKAAAAAEVKRAFRRLALETHPDRGGDPAAFIRARDARDAALGRL
ncbi:MAG: J domain-containing protein [Myxococcales bacterium]|nr:J domain-containing protein [Myxococcales bacterium]